jgi:aminoglycoside phosphotransferase (APT) family kinase protein
MSLVHAGEEGVDLRARRLAPSQEALARLAERLAPGSRVVRTRRLRGGLGCRMDALDIERPDGSRWRVSLRRFVRPRQRSSPQRVTREFEVLRLLERAGVPAPRPVLLDAPGEHFGVPMMVLTYLPGQPLYVLRDLERDTRGLASALRLVHAITPGRFDLSWLDVALGEDLDANLRRMAERPPPDALAGEVLEALVAERGRVVFGEAVLVHDDYWPGNTVWCRGRLAGIIDWTSAEAGDARVDVAQCRVDLTFGHSMDAADAFRDAYEGLAGGPLRDLWYFDLLRGIEALQMYPRWIEGYHDMGMTHLQPEAVEGRLRAFLLRALEEGERARGRPATARAVRPPSRAIASRRGGPAE